MTRSFEEIRRSIVLESSTWNEAEVEALGMFLLRSVTRGVFSDEDIALMVATAMKTMRQVCDAERADAMAAGRKS